MISAFFIIAASILIAAIGGTICKKSGVVNIALEGLMVIGAVTAAITHIFLESYFFSIPLALFFASLSGGIFSLLHAFASVTIKANQLILGMGFNLLSNGLAVFICQILFRMDRTPNYKTGISTGIFKISPVIWIALVILALVCFFAYKKPWRDRVNITTLRYTAIIISGFLAGLAGACLVLAQDNQFTVNVINGKGYIAFAIVYFRYNYQCSTTSVLPNPPISGLEK